MGLKVDAERPNLAGPLRDSSRGFPVAKYVAEGELCDYRHFVLVEVVLQLSCSDEDYVQDLLDLGVPYLRGREDLANKVYRVLSWLRVSFLESFDDQHGANHMCGSREV